MTDVATAPKRAMDRMQVRIEHLDTLLSLAGEVIITSANLQDLERHANSATSHGGGLGQEGLHLVKSSNEATRRISQDLHDLVMAIRLVEIGESFRLLRRPARDLCRNLGLEADIEFEGADTLIDKALSERLVDPLLHLLRNAIDHGIESPMDRKGAGKSVTGKVVVRAIDSEHHTEIQIQDDGAGVDIDAVHQAAHEMVGDRAKQLPILDLLCRPGLSTAKIVTNTSGRGVGLDLVQTVVDEFDGKIELTTSLGEGSTFTLRIPKLRAVNIIDALTLRAGPDLYALPIEQVIANIGLRTDDINTAFDRSQHFIYQDQVVPLHDLQTTLDQPAIDDDHSMLPVIILRGRLGLAAFRVSEFLGPQKLVNIPLDDGLNHHQAIAGTAVFTGGKLGLTVDVETLVGVAMGDDLVSAAAQVAQVVEQVSASQSSTSQEAEAKPATAPTSNDFNAPEGDEAEALGHELSEGLQKLQDTLISLEADPADSGLLNAAFRLLHAAKGHFTVLEAEAQAQLAHHLETVLDYLRAERLILTAERMDLILDGVTHLIEATNQLPSITLDPPTETLTGLQELTASEVVAQEDGVSLDDLVRQPFDLSPRAQLQVLSALKRGERTYETYLSFDPGRQPGFLAAYLLMRRIGKAGTVMSTLPTAADIEKGHCGRELKVLWSTPLNEESVDTLYDRLAPMYNLREHRTIPTTIFRYEAPTV